MMTAPLEFHIAPSRSSGEVPAILECPEGARSLLVLAHGAGAGMRHPFMQSLARALGARGIAALRYQFPYMEKGSRRPDPQPLLVATVRAAVAAARERAPDLALFAGGKSMGGRMSSLAAASAGALEGVRGLVFFGFPLHRAREPGIRRAEHLGGVTVPMLFLQGTRDALASIDLITDVVARLGPRAALHVVEGADHSFTVLKSARRDAGAVMDELADTVSSWTGHLI